MDHPGADNYWISVDKLQGGREDSPDEGKTVLLAVLGLHNTLGELPLYHGHSHQLELRLRDLLRVFEYLGTLQYKLVQLGQGVEPGLLLSYFCSTFRGHHRTYGTYIGHM